MNTVDATSEKNALGQNFELLETTWEPVLTCEPLLLSVYVHTTNSLVRVSCVMFL